MQAPGARPQVKCLLEKGEKIELIENHFTIPVSQKHTCTALHLSTAFVYFIYRSTIFFFPCKTFFYLPIPQDRHTDQLQRPKHYPEPVVAYTLKEMTVIWHMYGGRDFQPSTPPSSTSLSPSSSPHSSHRHNSNTTTATGHSNTHYYTSAQDQFHFSRAFSYQ